MSSISSEQYSVRVMFESIIQTEEMHRSSTLKDFDVISKLGEGSFSSVYKVRRNDDRVLYALKKVKIGQMSSKEKENSLNEVRILASISHPNIVNYKEAFFDDDSQTLCIVMEIAQDGDLLKKTKDHVKARTYFREAEIWKALIHMTRGLKVLHDMDILHRDLKCANVFCAGDGTMKLGDLNVSKVARRGLARTQTGTPYYTSPEVWKDRPYDSKCDIWSLGCVIYEMASLSPPFRASNLKELYNKIQKGLFDRIPIFYSDDLQSMVNELLRVNPVLRPTASEILNHRHTSKYHLPSDFYEKELPKLSLLKTIIVPRNLKSLKEVLPCAQYNNGGGSNRSSRVRENSNSSMVRVNSVNSISRVETPKISSRNYVRPNSERRYSHDRVDRVEKKPEPSYFVPSKAVRPASKNLYRNPSVDMIRDKSRQYKKVDNSSILSDARNKSKQIKDRLGKLIKERNEQLRRNQSEISRNVARALEAVKRVQQSPVKNPLKPRSGSYQNNRLRSPQLPKPQKYNPRKYIPTRGFKP